MSTNARISAVLSDGSVKSIYLHWGGYPEYAGACLVKHYETLEKVEELLALGDCSVLDVKLYPEGVHTFQKLEEDVSVFYGRDRGETDVAAKEFPDELTFAFVMKEIYEEYNYLFRNGVWYCWEGAPGALIPVNDLQEFKSSEFFKE